MRFKEIDESISSIEEQFSTKVIKKAYEIYSMNDQQSYRSEGVLLSIKLNTELASLAMKSFSKKSAKARFEKDYTSLMQIYEARILGTKSFAEFEKEFKEYCEKQRMLAIRSIKRSDK
ncbi:MAG: hypothetical protein ACP5RP_02850 [Candidatus Micrarchaeia archaeon]